MIGIEIAYAADELYQRPREETVRLSGDLNIE
jgi:hypothetical protein